MKQLSLLLLPVLALAACGSDEEAGVTVTDVWARTTAPGQTLGAVYFDVTVDDDDTLVGALVSSEVASGSEIHEVVPAENVDMTGDISGDMDGMDSSEGSHDMADMSTDDMADVGAVRMQQMTDGLALSAGETVSFAPGSYHVMLPELVEPLEAGEEFDLTLDFENAADVTVTVEVSETAP